MEIKNGAQMTPEEMAAIAVALRAGTVMQSDADNRARTAALFEALAKATATISVLAETLTEMDRQAIAASEKYDAAISELRGKVGR